MRALIWIALLTGCTTEANVKGKGDVTETGADDTSGDSGNVDSSGGTGGTDSSGTDGGGSDGSGTDGGGTDGSGTDGGGTDGSGTDGGGTDGSGTDGGGTDGSGTDGGGTDGSGTDGGGTDGSGTDGGGTDGGSTGSGGSGGTDPDPDTYDGTYTGDFTVVAGTFGISDTCSGTADLVISGGVITGAASCTFPRGGTAYSLGLTDTYDADITGTVVSKTDVSGDVSMSLEASITDDWSGSFSGTTLTGTFDGSFTYESIPLSYEAEFVVSP